MSLHTDIKASLPDAMKAKEPVKLSVIRGLITAFTNELVAQRRKPDEELLDEEALAVITRAAKQRKDSIEQFRKGEREDLAEKEETELEILETYLPKMMGREEIQKIAEAKKMELDIDDPAKKGLLMGAVMKELKGKADGADVKKVVDDLLQ
jgi:hypothetical protein